MPPRLSLPFLNGRGTAAEALRPTQPTSPTRILLVADWDDEAIKASLKAAGAGEISAELPESVHKSPDRAAGFDLVVIVLDLMDSGFGRAEDLVSTLRGCPVVVIAPALSAGQARKLVRAGALDAFELPLGPADWHDVLASVHPARAPGTAAGGRKGRTVAVLGAFGGAGATTLATQASIVAARTQDVLVVDLDLHSGTVALQLDVEPPVRLTQLMEQVDRLDHALLQSAAFRHSSGLSVVARPEELLPLDDVTPAFLDALIASAKDAFDVTVFDLPPVWSDWSVHLLGRVDRILLVTRVTVAGIAQSFRFLDMLDANGVADKCQIVVVGIEADIFGRSDTSGVEAAFGRKVDFLVANDAERVALATEQGRTLEEVGASRRLLRDVAAIAETILSAGLSAVTTRTDEVGPGPSATTRGRWTPRLGGKGSS